MGVTHPRIQMVDARAIIRAMQKQIDDVTRSLLEGELQSPALAMSSGPCVYGFWIKESALNDSNPKLPKSKIHRDGWHLCYIAHTPRSPSKHIMRLDRVISNQVYGSIASSSLLLTMAALLMDHLNLKAVKTDRFAKIENTRPLREWLLENSRYTIADTHQPWIDGPKIISEVNPIMSVRLGKAEFRKEIDKARRQLLEQCGVKRVSNLR
jgi:hypothetical protein